MSEKLSAEDIVNEFEEEIILFHDQDGEAYIAPEGDGKLVLKINTYEFKNYVAHRFWQKYQKPVPRLALQDALQILAGKAKFDGAEKQLSLRVGKIGKNYYYDLGDEAIQITSTGWGFTKPPIMFRRYPHQKVQDKPEYNGELDELQKFVNVGSYDDFILFAVFTVAAFIPGFPHPLLNVSGTHGSGKSTPMRLLKSLVDPSVIGGLPEPKDPAAFAQIAHHHWFVFFDNLSKMPLWFSDTLARAVTGDSFSKRALYTDDDTVFYTIQCPIALNGINQVVVRPDLLDRSILLKLDRINPEDRKPEGVFWAEFEEAKPRILGAIFTTLSKAITIHPNIEVGDLPRMADFMQWGYAIAEAAGFGGKVFVEAYKKNISKQNDEALEASPIAQVLINYLKTHDVLEGTATEILHVLNNDALALDLKTSPVWPKIPEWLARRVNEVEVNLQSRGIYVDHYKVDDQRHLRIYKYSKQEEQQNG